MKHIEYNKLKSRASTLDGTFSMQDNNIDSIYTTKDEKIEIIKFKNHNELIGITSSITNTSYYSLLDIEVKEVKNILMDMDGTSVLSENFWIEMLRLTVAKQTNNNSFQFHDNDMPFISGHSVTEHLNYCIKEYSLKCELVELKEIYDSIVDYNLDNNVDSNFFEPRKGLKEFLTTVKEKNIKVALVSSGSSKKVIYTLKCLFEKIDLGNPLDYYDCIITSGVASKKHNYCTMGELYAKPYPCLYEEAYYIGLGLTRDDLKYTIAIEDSASGIYSIRSSNMAPIGIAGGNIKGSGADSLCYDYVEKLSDIEKKYL